ncbi:hypothetical protein [Siccirubricoccus phaeus]|uniref:hypothetical protein n=1 Tax=Siccirubricoccus phaeus TaxID=2595053 RepID=UPI00165A2D4C|nr:hypothetical protein [Siccirubricoccus phaeus]
MLTADAAANLQRQFVNGNVDQREALLRGVIGISDPGVRNATLQLLERGRGDAGRLPAGSLARIGDMFLNEGFMGQQRARRILAAFDVDVSDRVKEAGETGEMQSAIRSARTQSVQGVLLRQAQITGNLAFSETAVRDEKAILHLATVNLASGETSVSRAVAGAQADWNGQRGVVNREGLAAVWFPLSQANPAVVETGLRVLKEREAIVPDTPMEQEAALAARQQAGAARQAEWINDGNQFALVAQGPVTAGGSGPRVVLRTATITDVLGAAIPNASAVSVGGAAGTRTGTEQRLEIERRRGGPPVPSRPQTFEE